MPRKSKRKSNFNKNVRKQVKKVMMDVMEPENHYASQILQTLAYTGNVDALSALAQGTTSQTRAGDEIRAKSIDIRGNFTAATTVGGTNTIRMILFRWKDDSAAGVPTMAQLLQATYAAASWTPLSPVVVGDDASSLSILSDRLFNLSYYGNPQVTFHIHRKLNYKQTFNAGATTGKNQLYLMMVSDDGAVSYPSIQYVSNYTFVDV